MAARLLSLLMFSLALIWWFRSCEIEPVIAALGFLVTFAQTFRPAESPAELKQRELKIKKRLEAAFPRSNVSLEDGAKRPFRQWENVQILVRALADKTYPGGNQTSVNGVHSWFGTEFYDFYHDGIMVLHRAVRVVLTTDGHWAVADSNADYDLTPYSEAKAIQLGCIPFRDIADVDESGDNHYPYPHVFCQYDQSGTPYEEYRFALCGPERDQPLFQALKFELQA